MESLFHHLVFTQGMTEKEKGTIFHNRVAKPRVVKNKFPYESQKAILQAKFYYAVA